MSRTDYHTITNHFQDVQLVSLSSWRQAKEITPRDRGGPYVVLQEGLDPNDPKLIPTQFVIGRAGKWLPLALFFRMPVPERQREFIFGTAAEVIQMMSDLPSKAAILSLVPQTKPEEPNPEDEEIASAIREWKNSSATRKAA